MLQILPRFYLAVEKDEQIMFEGAQGACLDVDTGFILTLQAVVITGQVEAGGGWLKHQKK